MSQNVHSTSRTGVQAVHSAASTSTAFTHPWGATLTNQDLERQLQMLRYYELQNSASIHKTIMDEKDYLPN